MNWRDNENQNNTVASYNINQSQSAKPLGQITALMCFPPTLYKHKYHLHKKILLLSYYRNKSVFKIMGI